MFLSRADIQNRVQRRYIEVPLHDGKVARLQSLTDLERMEWNQELFDETGKMVVNKWKYQTAKLLVRMLVDENGHRLFMDEDWELLLELDAKDGAVLGDEAREHIGAVDRDVKKSSTTGEPK